MTLASNPYVKAELDNLERQFGNKAYLDLDDYCALFGLKRRKASCHVRSHGVPHITMGQRALYIPVQELALYLARKKAEHDGEVRHIPVQVSADEMKNRRGFRRKAHEAQLAAVRK